MTASDDLQPGDGRDAADSADSSFARFAGPVSMLVVGAWALAKAWPMGPDIQVDFGRELYVPWRIGEGDRLYSDIAYFSGPLSVYLNALFFAVFGVGLSTLKLVNLVIVTGIGALFYKILCAITDRFSASVAGIFFAGAIAFGQSLKVGNYNYLTPYSHELTHGIALSLLGIWCLRGLGRGVAPTRVALQAGALLGLVLATKVEVFAAYAMALGVGFALDHRCARRGAPDAWAVLRALLLAFVASVAGLSLVLAIAAGPDVAFSGIVEPWRAVANSKVTSLPYYRWVRGTLNLSHSLMMIAEWFARYAVFFVALLGASLAWRGRRYAPLSGVVFGGLVLAFPLDPKLALNVARPLAILVPCLLAGLLFRIVVLRNRGVDARLEVFRVVVLTFCLALQLKMALNTQFNHYGFALIVPSALFFIAVVIDLGSNWVRRHSGSETVFRLGVAAAVAWVGLGIVARTDARFEERIESIGEGRDHILSDSRARQIGAALGVLALADPEATLAVMPEGIMVNYLARRVNPTRYINFMPPEMLLYGPATIVEAFEQMPPDYVVFLHKETRLYGYPFFGKEYGRLLYRWVVANYKPVKQIGAIPFGEANRFGIVIFERSDDPRT
jgi:hypothetical protein